MGRCRNRWHSEGQAEGPARAQGGGQKSRKEGPQGWGTEGGLVGEHRCDVEDGAWSAGLPGSKRCSAAALSSARAPPCQSVEEGAFRWPWGMVTAGATRVAIGHLRCGRSEVRRVLSERYAGFPTLSPQKGCDSSLVELYIDHMLRWTHFTYIGFTKIRYQD